MGRVYRNALISFVGFLCFLAFVVLWIANAEKLALLGLTDPIYFIVLVLVGLVAAGFLFGSLVSYAAYEGKVLNGTLRLSGPIVVVALTVVGGYVFRPKPSTFPLTVYVHGEHGPQDLVLRNSGRVMLQLGPDARSEQIGEKGQAYFPAVPATFRGQEVPAWVESESYESIDPRTKRRLDGVTLYLTVQRRVEHYKLAGTISDASGSPLVGVRVALPEYHVEAKTNRDGRFEVEVTAESQRKVELLAELPGYQAAHLSPTLGDTGFNFSLKGAP